MQNQPLSPAKNLGVLLHDVSRLLRNRLDHQAQEIGLTSAQWRVLVYLARNEGCNQAALAEVMDMEPITLSRHLDRMVADGQAERRPDPSDRRAYRLYLTEQARSLVTAFRSVTASVMAETVAGLSEAEISMMIELLGRLRANLTGKTDADPVVIGTKIHLQESVAS
jgi:DNA-binding MarR family transcriptional regulator